jgi:hypothetical protein
MSDMNDFERELEYELHRVIDPMTAGTIPAWRVTTLSGGRMKKLLGGAGAAIGVKILTGLAVAAAAATIAAAATEVAITGSVNPTNWGQQVKQQVDACKASAERLGVHGIGKCVASFARQHGDEVSDSHSKKDKSDKSNHENGNGKDKSKTHGQGSDKSQGSRPSIATAGEPTDPANPVHTSIPPQP